MEQPAEAGPLYAVSVTSFAQGFDMTSTLMGTTPSLSGGTLDSSRALEVDAGEFRIWPGLEPGVAYALISEPASIVRYALGEGGRMEQTGELGLAGIGITSLPTGGSLRIVAEHKGYALLASSWRAVAFDPQEMTITTDVDLAPLADPTPGYFAWDTHMLRGGELVGVAYYLDWVAETVESYTRAVFIDTDTDEARFADTSPCGGIGYLAWTDSGDLLGMPDPWSSATYRMGRAPAPCMIRISAGEHEIEELHLPAMSDSTLIVGGLIPGPQGSLFMRVLDEALSPVDGSTTAASLYSAPAWRTVRLGSDLSGGLEPVLELPPMAGGVTWFEVDGKIYMNDSTADFSGSVLIEMTNASGPTRGLAVPGVPFGIVRMR